MVLQIAAADVGLVASLLASRRLISIIRPKMNEHIYRYRGISSHSLAELINAEFYCSSPHAFNDPFDCKNLFSFNGASNRDWKIFFDRMLEQNRPELNKQQRDKLIKNIINSGDLKDKVKLEDQWIAWDKALSELTGKLGIVCFSEKNNDILMWSHYSNSHKGFCLQFNRAILSEQFYVGNVKYKAQYPTFSEFANANMAGMSNVMLLRKSPHWKYEKEVRLIVDLGSNEDNAHNRLFKYKPEALTGIIFGCQMPEVDKVTIRNIFNGSTHKISYYQAEKSRDSYSVKIHQV